MGLATMTEPAIIIPLAPGERAWTFLLADLAAAGARGPIVLCGPQAPQDLDTHRQGHDLRWVSCALGRGRQMNAGAAASDAQFLWFLHADSRLTPDAYACLLQALAQRPGDLHFFDLDFLADGPVLTKLNGWGARVRSRLLSMPFGDQGLCLARSTWERLGRFSENRRYGEDHAFIWQCLRARVPLRPVGAHLQTSARKYRDQGWLKTTFQHGYLTWRQAVPELVAFLKVRWGGDR